MLEFGLFSYLLLHKATATVAVVSHLIADLDVSADVLENTLSDNLLPRGTGTSTQPPLSGPVYLRPGRLSGYLGDKSRAHTHTHAQTWPCLICVMVSVESGQTHRGSFSSSPPSSVHPVNFLAYSFSLLIIFLSERKICVVSSATICHDTVRHAQNRPGSIGSPTA